MCGSGLQLTVPLSGKSISSPSPPPQKDAADVEASYSAGSTAEVSCSERDVEFQLQLLSEKSTEHTLLSSPCSLTEADDCGSSSDATIDDEVCDSRPQSSGVALVSDLPPSAPKKVTESAQASCRECFNAKKRCLHPPDSARCLRCLHFNTECHPRQAGKPGRPCKAKDAGPSKPREPRGRPRKCISGNSVKSKSSSHAGISKSAAFKTSTHDAVFPAVVGGACNGSTVSSFAHALVAPSVPEATPLSVLLQQNLLLQQLQMQMCMLPQLGLLYSLTQPLSLQQAVIFERQISEAVASLRANSGAAVAATISPVHALLQTLAMSSSGSM